MARPKLTEKTASVNVRMPPTLLKEIDDFYPKHGYATRTDFIITAAKNEMQKVNMDSIVAEEVNRYLESDEAQAFLRKRIRETFKETLGGLI